MTMIRIGHTPDPDDAFMFYALTAGKVKAEGCEITHVLEDIESLNQRARTAELEVTAISAAAYPQLADRYRIMDCGASMGKGYGPILVTRQPMDPGEIPDRVVAIPGRDTTSALLLQIYCGDPKFVEMAFDEIPKAVLDGEVEVGLLIHEGQITHQAMGLHKVLDLGEAWERESGLPLPLGINVVRRDLGESTGVEMSEALRRSIAYAHAHIDEAIEYAMRYGRGIDHDTCRRFVLMYVNNYTLTLGDEGREALKLLLSFSREKGRISEIPPLDPI